MKKKSLVLTVFFSGVFLVLAAQLLLDERTYVQPPSPGQARQRVEVLTAVGHAGTVAAEKKNELVRYMISPARFHVHRFLLAVLFECYLLSIWGLWFRRRSARKLMVITFLIKILHAGYFLWIAYLGRVAIFSYFGQSTPPFFVGDNEIYFLLSIVISLMCLFYLATPFPRRVWLRARLSVPSAFSRS